MGVDFEFYRLTLSVIALGARARNFWPLSVICRNEIGTRGEHSNSHNFCLVLQEHKNTFINAGVPVLASEHALGEVSKRN